MFNFKSPFLAVQTSFWPFLVSLSLFSLASTGLLFIHNKTSGFLLFFQLFLVLFIAFLWWKDFYRERLLGYHTHKLELSLRCGILLFILSEVFFFVSFFWAFYDSSLSPVFSVGLVWPPVGIVPLSFYSVPLLNTVILLTSGISVTWAHHSLVNNFFIKSVLSLFLTIFLGSYFLFMQWVEYSESSFAMSDGVYGSCFFMATGFHGFHVLVGTTFLLVVFFILLKGGLLYNHHFSFEAAAWYWHFVDVVWLILFLYIFWWGA
jgi:cytochrome c oxidase subunit 3